MNNLYLQFFILFLTAVLFAAGTWFFVVRHVLKWRESRNRGRRQQLETEPSRSGRKFKIKRKSLVSQTRKIAILSSAALVLWGIWGYFALHWARDAYGKWLRPLYYARAADTTESQAARFLEEGRLSRATRIFTDSLREMPANAELYREFATLLRQIGDPAALEFQEMAIELEKGDPTADKLLLIEYLTAFRDVKKANAELQSLPPEVQGSARGQLFKGALSIHQDLPKTARTYYQNAYDLAPDDPAVRLGHELWTLTDLDLAGRKQRLLQFENTSGDLPMESVPLQILLTHLMQTDAIGEEAAPLVQAIRRSVSPWDPAYFLYLIWTDRYQPDKLEKEIESIIDDPVARRRSFVRLMPWLASNGHLDMAHRLATTGDEELDNFAQATLWEARLRVHFKETEALRACLSKPGWATIRSLRAAYEEWANRADAPATPTDPDETAASGGGEAWQSALYWARREIHLLGMLYGMVQNWGWEAESEDVLFVMASTNHPRHLWATTRLLEINLQRRDLIGYLKVINAARRVNPNDIRFHNDAIYLSSLIYPKGQVFDEALQLFYDHQENFSVRGTYAFLLAKSGLQMEALDLFKEIPEDRLKNSPEALAYALALEKKDPGKALIFARSALPFMTFPEEQTLCKQLIERLEQRVN